MIEPMYVLVGITGLIVFILITHVKIIPQSEAVVVSRLGSYRATWNVGVHLMMPFIDKIESRISLKELVVNFMPQPVITKDNITISIDTVLFYQITDPFAYTYGVSNPLLAIENLTTTALRNIIGDLELDETLTSRDVINSRIRANLDEATNSWGIKVVRMEVRNIVPPKDIQDTMEKQMRAERERREAILKAEGEKKSAILVAEGNKQARILSAEADKESRILDAQAEREAAILRAEGEKEAAIKAAEAEAQAILEVQSATAKGIELINKATPTEQAIALKALDAFTAMANGQATKIVIPSDIQGLAGLSTSISEIIKGSSNNK